MQTKGAEEGGDSSGRLTEMWALEGDKHSEQNLAVFSLNLSIVSSAVTLASKSKSVPTRMILGIMCFCICLCKTLSSKITRCALTQWVVRHPRKAKGHQFNSWSGNMPGLQASSPVGGLREATNQRFSRTLMFFSLLSLLSKNK